MGCKVTGGRGAVGYWGRSPYKRIEQEFVPQKIRALLQDKLIARGQPAWLYLPVTSGTPCTCNKETSQTADRPCPECYGTGFVPGYTRFLSETVFYTASQIAHSGTPAGGRSLAADYVTPSTAVYTPTLTSTAARSLSPSALSVASVHTPSIRLAGSLQAPFLNVGSVSTPAITTQQASFTNLTLETRMKPNYVRLVDGALSGTLVTGAIPYSNEGGDAWEARSEHYLRATDQTITVEVSTDLGASWAPLSSLVATGTGYIKFRVTLTRTSTAQRSPLWSAVRARHVRSVDYARRRLTRVRGNLSTGQILVLRPWVVEQAASDTGRGTTIDWMSDRSWTMPLDFFDTSITADTNPARIDDRAPGPHPFYEYASGIKQGDRVVLSALKWNEELGTFTHQSFDERRVQDNEPPYGDVF